jgi:predicted amidohydrolase YtcJ
MQAITAVTLDAAWQPQKDDIGGGPEVGKYADPVILGADLNAVEPDTIRDIAIHETRLEGRRRFAA